MASHSNALVGDVAVTVYIWPFVLCSVTFSVMCFCFLQGTDENSAIPASSSSTRLQSSRTRANDEPHIGKYRLIKTIGKGNFAKVKLAKHVPTGREVSHHHHHHIAAITISTDFISPNSIFSDYISADTIFADSNNSFDVLPLIPFLLITFLLITFLLIVIMVFLYCCCCMVQFLLIVIIIFLYCYCC